MRPFVFALLLILQLATLAQTSNVMYLKDGKEIPFKSRNWYQNRVTVKKLDKTKVVINVTDIDYYYLNGKRYFYVVGENKVESVSVEAEGPVTCFMYVEVRGRVYIHHLYLESAVKEKSMVHCSGLFKEHALKISMSDQFRAFFNPAPQLLNGLTFSRMSMNRKIQLVKELNTHMMKK